MGVASHRSFPGGIDLMENNTVVFFVSICSMCVLDKGLFSHVFKVSKDMCVDIFVALI